MCNELGFLKELMQGCLDIYYGEETITAGESTCLERRIIEELARLRTDVCRAVFSATETQREDCTRKYQLGIITLADNLDLHLIRLGHAHGTVSAKHAAAALLADICEGLESLLDFLQVQCKPWFDFAATIPDFSLRKFSAEAVRVLGVIGEKLQETAAWDLFEILHCKVNYFLATSRQCTFSQAAYWRDLLVKLACLAGRRCCISPEELYSLLVYHNFNGSSLYDHRIAWLREELRQQDARQMLHYLRAELKNNEQRSELAGVALYTDSTSHKAMMRDFLQAEISFITNEAAAPDAPPPGRAEDTGISLQTFYSWEATVVMFRLLNEEKVLYRKPITDIHAFIEQHVVNGKNSGTTKGRVCTMYYGLNRKTYEVVNGLLNTMSRKLQQIKIDKEREGKFM